MIFYAPRVMQEKTSYKESKNYYITWNTRRMIFENMNT